MNPLMNMVGSNILHLLFLLAHNVNQKNKQKTTELQKNLFHFFWLYPLRNHPEKNLKWHKSNAPKMFMPNRCVPKQQPEQIVENFAVQNAQWMTFRQISTSTVMQCSCVCALHAVWETLQLSSIDCCGFYMLYTSLCHLLWLCFKLFIFIFIISYSYLFAFCSCCGVCSTFYLLVVIYLWVMSSFLVNCSEATKEEGIYIFNW